MHLASMIWYFDTSISHMKVRAIRSALVGFRSPLNHIRNGVICPRGDVPGIGFLRHKSTLDITTTNEASLSRATSEGQKTAWHLGGALTRFDRRVSTSLGYSRNWEKMYSLSILRRIIQSSTRMKFTVVQV